MPFSRINALARSIRPLRSSAEIGTTPARIGVSARIAGGMADGGWPSRSCMTGAPSANADELLVIMVTPAMPAAAPLMNDRLVVI